MRISRCLCFRIRANSLFHWEGGSVICKNETARNVYVHKKKSVELRTQGNKKISEHGDITDSIYMIRAILYLQD